MKGKLLSKSISPCKKKKKKKRMVNLMKTHPNIVARD